MTDENTTVKPALNIFTRRLNSDGTTSLGSQIGVGFEHKKGEGFNIVLDAAPIPIQGRIELVAFPPKSKA